MFNVLGVIAHDIKFKGVKYIFFNLLLIAKNGYHFLRI